MIKNPSSCKKMDDLIMKQIRLKDSSMLIRFIVQLSMNSGLNIGKVYNYIASVPNSVSYRSTTKISVEKDDCSGSNTLSASITKQVMRT